MADVENLTASFYMKSLMTLTPVQTTKICGLKLGVTRIVTLPCKPSASAVSPDSSLIESRSENHSHHTWRFWPVHVMSKRV